MLLAAVHGWKGRKPQGGDTVNPAENEQERASVAAAMGLQRQAMPAHIAALVAWGEEQDRKLGVKHE